MSDSDDEEMFLVRWRAWKHVKAESEEEAKEKAEKQRAGSRHNFRAVKQDGEQ